MKRQRKKLTYCVTISSSCLPDSDHALTPYLRLSGSDGTWTPKQSLCGQFRPGQLAKFRFNSFDVGEIKRIQLGIENVNQLETVYNNAQMEPCWVVNQDRLSQIFVLIYSRTPL